MVRTHFRIFQRIYANGDFPSFNSIYLPVGVTEMGLLKISIDSLLGNSVDCRLDMTWQRYWNLEARVS